MLIKCVISHPTKHITKDAIYKVKQESKDNTEFLVENDMEYVTWVSKSHFIKIE